MAKVINPNDHELWLELLQIKKSRKGSYDEQQINEIIDRYINQGLVFKDDPYTGLTKALSVLRKKRRRNQVTKNVLSIFLIVLVVAVLAGFGYKYFNDLNDNRIAQQQTQTAESMALSNTQTALETKSFRETSTAWALQNPTQTSTVIPTETPTPFPAWTPTQQPLYADPIVVSGNCTATTCSWIPETPIDPGSYALFIAKSAQETDVIIENLGEITIFIPDTVTINLQQCVGLNEGERCFIGTVDLMEQLSNLSGNSEYLASETLLEVNLEFFQTFESDETLEIVTDFLVPTTVTIDLPLCQSGECTITASYRPTRQLTTGSELRFLPLQTIQGIKLYYVLPDKDPIYIEQNASGWAFSATPVDGGYFVVTTPVEIGLAEPMVLLVVKPNSPENPRE